MTFQTVFIMYQQCQIEQTFPEILQNSTPLIARQNEINTNRASERDKSDFAQLLFIRRFVCSFTISLI